MVRDTFAANAFADLVGKRSDVVASTDHGGNERPQTAVVADEEFDRGDVMRELKRASTTIEDLLASDQAITRPTPQAREAIEALLTQGRRLANDDPDYSADDHYVRQAEEMTNAATQLKKLLGTVKHGEAKKAVRSIGAACSACHSAFNP